MLSLCAALCPTQKYSGSKGRVACIPFRREGSHLAASRTSSEPTADNARFTTSRRVSFAKIQEPLQTPDLLGLQLESFDWLLGNERWQARVAAATESRSEERRVGDEYRATSSEVLMNKDGISQLR